MSKEIQGITDKMLSKELRDMEVNQLIKRTVYDPVPVIVEYSMTPCGKTLEGLIDELQKWGVKAPQAHYREKRMSLFAWKSVNMYLTQFFTLEGIAFFTIFRYQVWDTYKCGTPIEVGHL